MGNLQKESIVNQLIAFVTDKKKLPVLLLLLGSGDDNGSQITLNSQGRPVWLVSSNSTDGDFAEAGASNTDGRYKVYSVTF